MATQIHLVYFRPQRRPRSGLLARGMAPTETWLLSCEVGRNLATRTWEVSKELAGRVYATARGGPPPTGGGGIGLGTLPALSRTLDALSLLSTFF